MATLFGDNSDGFANETEIVNYINSTGSYTLLNDNMKAFISFLFQGHSYTSAPIRARKTARGVKPDIIITINGTSKYVSIKKGSGNSVHQEPLDLFTRFLAANNVRAEIIQALKQFHYGDGTDNGTGRTRISASSWISNHPAATVSINRSFTERSLLLNFINRVLFTGNVNPTIAADAIFHGNINRALWASKEEITAYLLTHDSLTNNSIHFSNLTYQVWNRNLGFNPNTESRRHVMQVKWASLTTDLSAITRNRTRR